MMAPAVIRPLRAADTAVLAAMLARAYAPTSFDFEPRLKSYLTLPSVATFVADCGGEPAGMVVGSDYGQAAYVALMGVDPRLQRRGIATALMDNLIAWADARRVAAVELDATPAGAPLYARYGFIAAGQTFVYQANDGASVGDAHAARPYCPGDRDSVFAIDLRAFGADRRAVLGGLIGDPRNAVFVTGPLAAVVGYGVAQLRSQILGPVIAQNAAAAARLIDAARARLSGAHRVNLPSYNDAARSIVSARGYRLSRTLAHMIRGTRPCAAEQTLFARINLGQG